MLKVKRVLPGSIGEELGIEQGDCVTAFNGRTVADVLDYSYYDAETEFTMTVTDGDCETEFEIEKDSEETLGLEFTDESCLSPLRCRNNCKFCFVSQLPKGLRKSLYVKDDDWRLSLVSGNFVTLTNLTEADLRRVLDMRMSPLYISVHSLNPSVRSRLMGNPRAGELAGILRRLDEAGIVMHCQIVLCPGYNDGADLDATLAGLATLPRVASCAIVPVGLTAHRAGLTPLKPVGEAEARAAVAAAERANERAGHTLAACSDEMYQLANLPFPPRAWYGDFPQLENGVGLYRKLEEEFTEALSGAPRSLSRRATLVTGMSAAPLVSGLARRLCARVKGLALEVAPIRNDFFGHSITVAGLVTGGDIAAQLAGRELGEFVVLPGVMLREFTTVFLDDMSVEQLSNRLGVPVRVAGPDGESFIQTILR